MSQSMIPFDFQGNNVRVHLDEQSNPWFAAVDVCNALDISNSRDALNRLKDKEILSVGFTDTVGRPHSLNMINESGLYRLFFRSNKPQAEPFKDWICEDVIPTIRKTGRYQVPNTPVLPQTSAQIAQDIIARYEAFDTFFVVPRHVTLIEASKELTKAGFDVSGFLAAAPAMNEIEEGEKYLEPTELAHKLGIKSAIEMNKILEGMGLQYRQGKTWVATERAAGMFYEHSWNKGSKSGYNLKWNVESVRTSLEQYLEVR